MKIVFFGTDKYTKPVIESLKKEFELTIFKTPQDKDVLTKIGAEIAIVVNFGFLISKETLSLFPKGVLNIHPSLLPKYRGATPGQSAILNGDKTTGVSIIKLDEKMDHGPILWQQEEEIKENNTAEDLYLRLFKIASNNINDVVHSYLKNEIDLKIQDDNNATYVEKLTRESGKINTNNPPSPETLNKMIKAYYPWPGVWTEIEANNKKLRIKFLPEKMLQMEGKKPINLKDFENGYPEIYNKLTKLY